MAEAAPAPRKAAPPLELYQREDCPYSQTVRAECSRLGLDFVAHTVPAGNDLKHQELVAAAGKDQIPFLVDHRTGVRMLESEAIVQYLRHEYGKGEEIPDASQKSEPRRPSTFRQPLRMIRRRLPKFVKGAVSLGEFALSSILIRAALSRKSKQG